MANLVRKREPGTRSIQLEVVEDRSGEADDEDPELRVKVRFTLHAEWKIACGVFHRIRIGPLDDGETSQCRQNAVRVRQRVRGIELRQQFAPKEGRAALDA